MTYPCGAYDQQSCEETRLSLTLEDQDMLCSSCNLGREPETAAGCSGKKRRSSSPPHPLETPGRDRTSLPGAIKKDSKKMAKVTVKQYCWGCGQHRRLIAFGLCKECRADLIRGELDHIHSQPDADTCAKILEAGHTITWDMIFLNAEPVKEPFVGYPIQDTTPVPMANYNKDWSTDFVVDGTSFSPCPKNPELGNGACFLTVDPHGYMTFSSAAHELVKGSDSLQIFVSTEKNKLLLYLDTYGVNFNPLLSRKIKRIAKGKYIRTRVSMSRTIKDGLVNVGRYSLRKVQDMPGVLIAEIERSESS